MSIDLETVQSALYSTYHKHEVYHGGSRKLVDELHLFLPHIDRSEWRERMDFGGVHVNGIPHFEDALISPPFKVEYYEPKYEISKASSHYSSFSPTQIVWEDDWFVVTAKPSKLPSMPTKEQRRFNLKRFLQEHYGRELHFPSRLDTATCGLLIASKDTRTHGLLQQLFEKKEIQKVYLLATLGSLDESRDVTEPIGKSSLHPVLRAINGKDSKSAFTGFCPIGISETSVNDGSIVPCSIIEARPLTGRTHQIRVHATYIDLPIIGDKFYGGAKSEGLHLVSYAILFIHPVTGKVIHVTLPVPEQPKWLQIVADRLL